MPPLPTSRQCSLFFLHLRWRRPDLLFPTQWKVAFFPIVPQVILPRLEGIVNDFGNIEFQLLVDAQGWNELGKVIQIVFSVSGLALEILCYLIASQHTSYTVLKSRFGHQYQAEVFRFRTQTREDGDSL